MLLVVDPSGQLKLAGEEEDLAGGRRGPARVQVNSEFRFFSVGWLMSGHGPESLPGRPLPRKTRGALADERLWVVDLRLACMLSFAARSVRIAFRLLKRTATSLLCPPVQRNGSSWLVSLVIGDYWVQTKTQAPTVRAVIGSVTPSRRPARRRTGPGRSRRFRCARSVMTCRGPYAGRWA